MIQENDYDFNYDYTVITQSENFPCRQTEK